MYTSVRFLSGNLYVYGYTKSGARVKFSNPDWKPKYYIGCELGENRDGWSDIHGNPLREIYVSSLDRINNEISRHRKKLKLYGDIQVEYQFISDVIDGDSPATKDTSNIKILNFDIEVVSNEGFPKSGEKPILSIASLFDSKMTVFGLKDYTKSTDTFEYIKCSNELDLIEKFINYFVKCDPDVITGWNVKFFDIPYLIDRIKRISNKSLSNKLSPFERIREHTAHRKGQPSGKAYEIVGRTTLDAMSMYKKFTYKERSSYSLNHISNVELDQSKIDYGQIYDSLQELYENDFNTFIDYNIEDVWLVDRILKKLSLIETGISMAYEAGVNFQDIFMPVRVWDVRIYRHLKKRKIAIPPKDGSFSYSGYAGGYVKSPMVGKHKWVVSYDLTSLYPHVIMTLNIGPETINTSVGYEIIDIDKAVENGGFSSEISRKCRKFNCAIGANGYYFSKDKKSVFNTLMAGLFKERQAVKKEMLDLRKKGEDVSDLDNRQQALKILLNAASGALGNEYFRWSDNRCVEAITITGQMAIKWAEKAVNAFLNDKLETNGVDYIIAIDTDSIYVNLERYVDSLDTTDTDKIVKLLNQFSNDHMQPLIDKIYLDLTSRVLNAYDNLFMMKREDIADAAIWCAKKRYILHIRDSEGTRYEDGKIKVMGLDIKKATIPAECKKSINSMLKTIFFDSESKVQGYIKEFRNVFNKLPIEEISFPRGVRNVTKWINLAKEQNREIAKATPIHVRGAIEHNNLVKQLEIEDKVEMILDGDKTKFVYLKEPNPFNTHVIGFRDRVPKEFGIDPYVDRDKQFEKSFLNPISQILSAVNYSPTKVNTLAQFFT